MIKNKYKKIVTFERKVLGSKETVQILGEFKKGLNNNRKSKTKTV